MFDGDELNIHVVQTIESIAELQTIANVKDCIMNSQNNQSIIALVMDTLTGGYLLSDPTTRIEPNYFLDYIATILEPNQDFSFTSLQSRLSMHKIPIYSGPSLFSALLPSDFYYENAGVSIRDGILVKGRLSKKSLGNTANSIIQVMWNVYGAERVSKFITDSYRVIDRWLSSRGLSIGLQDCIVNKPIREKQIVQRIVQDTTNKILSLEEPNLSSIAQNSRATQIQTILNTQQKALSSILKKSDAMQQTLDNMEIRRQTLAEIETLLQPLENPELEKNRQIELETLIKKNERSINAAVISAEQKIQIELEKARVKVSAQGDVPLDDTLAEERRQKQIGFITNQAQQAIGKAIVDEYLNPDNAFKIMIESGAKGNLGNIAQITGALGQMFFMGDRIKPTLTTASGIGKRTLPYFPNDIDIESRGFVVNNFLKGLNPAEMFFTLVAGRQNLIDTGLKTADSGSIHHQIVKVLEDMKVATDGSIRNAGNRVFQYAYGDDNFEPRALYRTKTPVGDLVSFIDMNSTVGQINAKYGFY